MPFLGTTGGGSVKQFGGLANLGYFIKNSLRFRGANNAYLNRTPSASDRTTWTWSGWVKRGTLGAYQQIFGAYIGSGTTDTNYFEISFSSSDLISITGYSTVYRRSTAVYRDPSAWYHIVVALDTTQATAANRMKVYVNGSEVTAFGASNNPTLSTNLGINGAYPHGIGAIPANASYFDGYQTEVNFIDGQALTPSSFGKTDGATGQWVPKKFGGTYGTNGFYLKFADASAATAAAIGKDSSPNGNNWTPNNISVTAGITYDAMIDSPSLSAAASNYATLNPLSMAANLVLNSGNLAVSNSNGADTHRIVRAGIGMTTGKWYWEVHVNNSANVDIVGVADDTTGNAGNNYLGGTGKSAGWGYNTSTGAWYQGPWTVNSPTPPAFPSSGIIGVAYDADAGNLWFSSNGSWLSANGGTGNPAAGSNPNLSLANTAGTPFYPALSIYYNGGTWVFNFGQRPFAYTPPSGFKSLNTFNLP